MSQRKASRKAPVKGPHVLQLNNDKKLRYIKENDVIRQQVSQLVEEVFAKTREPPNSKITAEFEAYKSIYELIQKIVRLEEKISPLLVVDRNSSDVQERLLSWLKNAGATFENLQIANYDGYGLGIKAQTDINKEKLLCSIPRSVMLSHDKIKTSGAFGKFVKKDPMLSEMSNVALAMFLLYEKSKKNSYWKPYIDMLPANYSTVHYFTPEEMAQLTGTRALKPALYLFKSLARQYCYFFSRFWGTDDAAAEQLREYFTFENYRWAVSTVMTRENLIPSVNNTNEGVLALIPFWDLTNHAKGTITTGYNVNQDRSECFAMRDFKKDEQVFIHYHHRSNLDCFLHNGFVFDESENDVYPLDLGVSSSDKLYQQRSEVLKKLGLTTSETFYIQDSLSPFDEKLLKFARVFCMDKEQLENAEKLIEFGEGKECVELEIKTWKFLQMRLKLLQAAFKTTLEDDLNLLMNIEDKDKERSLNERLAIKMRACDKNLLAKFSALIEARLRILLQTNQTKN